MEGCCGSWFKSSIGKYRYRFLSNVNGCILLLIFHLLLVVFFKQIAVNSAATENVVPNKEKRSKTKSEMRYNMERQFVHAITGEPTYSRGKETRLVKPICWNSLVKMKTYRLVGGKHQAWNHTRGKPNDPHQTHLSLGLVQFQSGRIL